jgi:hypothetical protein
MKGPNLECSAGAIISNTDLPFQSREECVKAMGELFRRFFAVNSLETSGLMWWDSMCFDWDCGNRNRKRGGEDLLLQDILFRTLSDILELDSPFCQGAALHGLGHLHHPGTKELIGSYLERHPNLSAEQKDYATAAARFEVL